MFIQTKKCKLTGEGRLHEYKQHIGTVIKNVRQYFNTPSHTQVKLEEIRERNNIGFEQVTNQDFDGLV